LGYAAERQYDFWAEQKGNGVSLEFIGKRLEALREDKVLSPSAAATTVWQKELENAGDGAAFQLACEAKRIDLAFLFDPMMAVHSSNVEPLPHQITAVLADDPGAGKTIMVGQRIHREAAPEHHHVDRPGEGAGGSGKPDPWPSEPAAGRGE
jgi:hypothetical protein